MTNGAVIRSWRKPATKVVVFQCPCGSGATNRSLRGARPRRRPILVEAPVSSINTSCLGSKPFRRFRQATRASATSGLSCSAACAVFFNADPVALEEPPDCAKANPHTAFAKSRAVLLQGRIRRLGKPRQKPILLRLYGRRATVPSHSARRYHPAFPPQAYPGNRCARANLEKSGCRAPRYPAFNGSYNTFPKICRIHPATSLPDNLKEEDTHRVLTIRFGRKVL